MATLYQNVFITVSGKVSFGIVAFVSRELAFEDVKGKNGRSSMTIFGEKARYAYTIEIKGLKHEPNSIPEK